jgi:hypothetical protein
LSSVTASGGEWPRARTRLFLSADIAGSTAYKQRKSDESPTERWAFAILSFYRDFGQQFLEKLELAENAVAAAQIYKRCNKRPLFWKAVGDEVLFCLELTNEDQAYLALGAWINAARAYKKTLKKERLDLKLSAWLATFPTPNFEVALPRSLDESGLPQTRVDDALVANWEALKQYYTGSVDAQKNYTLDFVGPAMDTGFRIAQQSTTRKMVITPELARLIALSDDRFKKLGDQLDDAFKLDLRYEGRVVLKGVGDPSGYPLFWIDVAEKSDRIVSLEDKLDSSRKEMATTTEIAAFVEAYLSDYAPFKTLLYLPDADRTEFSNLRAELKEQLREIQAKYENEARRLTSEMNQDEPVNGQANSSVSNSELEKLVSVNTKPD